MFQVEFQNTARKSTCDQTVSHKDLLEVSAVSSRDCLLSFGQPTEIACRRLQHRLTERKSANVDNPPQTRDSHLIHKP